MSRNSRSWTLRGLWQEQSFLGTTKGDIHQISTALIGTLVAANGYRVYDLGVDVSGETFAAKARELREACSDRRVFG